ncbi:MAG TPA: hypothetical protein ENK75_00780 [Saprospiraceae bacterium]|nr:hypothetical protein [Saprospiraceae bacterium]
MKKRFLTIGLFSIILSLGIYTQSCDKAIDLVAFDVNQTMPDQHFDIDSASTTAKGMEKILHEAYFDINFDSVLAANGIDKGKISDAQFKEITMSIDNPTPEMELGFVSTFTLKVYSTNEYNDGKTIASATGIKTGDKTATFTVENESLDTYFENSKFYYRIYGTLEHPIAVSKLPLIFSSKTKFTVKPLK